QPGAAALQRSRVGAALDRRRRGGGAALLPHPGAARDAPPAALRPHTRRAGVVHRARAARRERARRRADLLRYLRPPPAFALRRRRDGYRLDPLLPRAHGLDVQEASLLDALGHPRASELLL